MKNYIDGLDEGIEIGRNAVLNILESSLDSKRDSDTIVNQLKRYLEMRDKWDKK